MPNSSHIRRLKSKFQRFLMHPSSLSVRLLDNSNTYKKIDDPLAKLMLKTLKNLKEQ